MQKELFDSGEILPYRHAFLLDGRGRPIFEHSCPVRFGRETGVAKEIPNGKKESIVVWEIGSHGLELVSMIGMRRLMIGSTAVRPISRPKRSCPAWVATAVSPMIVSGRAVAISMNSVAPSAHRPLPHGCCGPDQSPVMIG